MALRACPETRWFLVPLVRSNDTAHGSNYRSRNASAYGKCNSIHPSERSQLQQAANMLDLLRDGARVFPERALATSLTSHFSVVATHSSSLLQAINETTGVRSKAAFNFGTQ